MQPYYEVICLLSVPAFAAIRTKLYLCIPLSWLVGFPGIARGVLETKFILLDVYVPFSDVVVAW
jgi:hypothetical protein